MHYFLLFCYFDHLQPECVLLLLGYYYYYYLVTVTVLLHIFSCSRVGRGSGPSRFGLDRVTKFSVLGGSGHSSVKSV